MDCHAETIGTSSVRPCYEHALPLMPGRTRNFYGPRPTGEEWVGAAQALGPILRNLRMLAALQCKGATVAWQ